MRKETSVGGIGVFGYSQRMVRRGVQTGPRVPKPPPRSHE